MNDMSFSTIAHYYDALYVRPDMYGAEADAVNRPEIGIARMENVRRKSESVVEVSFHHLIGKSGQVRYHTQTMEIGLYSEEGYVSLFGSAGLSLVERYREPDIMMGAFVGRKD